MFSRGVERALQAAHAAHDGQVRKGTDCAPYILHPVHVALIVARWGADDAIIQAAILHDVVEDCEEWTVERVSEGFGDEVAAIVNELSEDKSKSWEERKQAAVDSIPGLSASACVVKAGDKLHNLQSLFHDLERAGRVGDRDSVWSRFNGGRDRTLAMDRKLVDALAARLDAPAAAELRDAMTSVEQIA